MPRPTILRVGLTGNIGAGKSVVASYLAEHGCLIIDADRLARHLLRAGSEATAEIVAAFGTGVRAADGSVDRRALAGLAFADDDARRRLEAILHPRIRELEEARVAAWRVPRGIAVTEAALLVETGGADRYHRLVVVTAPTAVRLRRLVARGMSADDARARMRAQMTEEDKRARGDYVIDNGGTLEATRSRAAEVMASLRHDLQALERDGALPEAPPAPQSDEPDSTR